MCNDVLVRTLCRTLQCRTVDADTIADDYLPAMTQLSGKGRTIPIS